MPPTQGAALPGALQARQLPFSRLSCVGSLPSSHFLSSPSPGPHFVESRPTGLQSRGLCWDCASLSPGWPVSVAVALRSERFPGAQSTPTEDSEPKPVPDRAPAPTTRGLRLPACSLLLGPRVTVWSPTAVSFLEVFKELKYGKPAELRLTAFPVVVPFAGRRSSGRGVGPVRTGLWVCTTCSVSPGATCSSLPASMAATSTFEACSLCFPQGGSLRAVSCRQLFHQMGKVTAGMSCPASGHSPWPPRPEQVIPPLPHSSGYVAPWRASGRWQAPVAAIQEFP